MSIPKQPNADLVPVHGGLSEPVDRTVSLKERGTFLREAASLPSIHVSNADLSTVYRLADGALSPLEGPMSEALWNEVLDRKSIERGGVRYAWTIPLALPVTDAEVAGLSVGGSVALQSEV